MNKIRISEIFYGLQGEGKKIGQPTLFIRLSGCTLKCSFCDTKYHTNARKLDKKDINLLQRYKNWTITGGEPLLQQKAIIELIDQYKPTSIDIETNGTIIPSSDLIKRISCFNISPKEKRFQPKELKKKTIPNILSIGSKIKNKIVKFVYSDKKSSFFISSIISKYNIQPHEVWIMPEGRTRKEQEKKQKEAWGYCMKKGFNFSPRAHISVFNIRRKV